MATATRRFRRSLESTPDNGGGGVCTTCEPGDDPNDNDPIEDDELCPLGTIADGNEECIEEEDPCEIDTNQLETVFPNASTAVLSEISEKIRVYGEDFGINNSVTASHFLAQTGYESQGMTTLIENMNYSAERLVAVWPNRFSFTDPDKKDPFAYAYDPEKLANYVYANRLGNGGISSGDGWNYRGRGFMQLTGKNNYQAFNSFYATTFTDIQNFVQNPDLISSNLDNTVISAMWFFKVNVLDIIDELDIIVITDLVSGSDRTSNDRNLLFNNIESTIEC